jgi:hypothetical protein
MITSEGFTSRGHLMVQAPQEVQYQGIDSSITLWNCFFLMSIRTLKGVLPDSGQLPVHFPHWIQVNTLVWAWVIILYLFECLDMSLCESVAFSKYFTLDKAIYVPWLALENLNKNVLFK